MTTQPNLAELRRLLDAATQGKCDVTYNARHEESRIYIGDHVRALFDGRVLLNDRADAELFAALRNAADWLIRAAEERDVLRDLLSQAFFTLQGMEIVWNHEQGCDRFAASMQRYADSAVRLEGLIEPMLNKLGVETSFKLTGCRREAPKAGEEKTQ